MRRPGVRIPSRPPSFKTTSSVPNSSYLGTLGLSSLPDSFRYLVIHPERHCLSAASSVNTTRLVGTDARVAIRILGSEEARSRAGLRPPPKLPVHISCRQLSRRLSNAERQERELSRSGGQARTRRKAGP